MPNSVLSQEELQQVKEIRKQTLELVSALGELSYQEVLVSIEKNRLTEAVKNVREAERSLLDEFGKKYGDGIIDLETGEIQSRP